MRYYFDVNDGAAVSVDELGIDCADLAQVRYRAIDALPDLARDELPNGDDRVLSVSVRDEAGRRVFSCSLTLKVSWP
ncbi:hypothetical protein [Mesorhizobium sp. CAU 1741]|uniref:DUF6894 family protein n=1 Tax=Mesorhizobium sp. CAU 1741 TaxID=3140366 RepID=UPI00325B227A